MRVPTLHLLPRNIERRQQTLGFLYSGMWRSLVAHTAGGRGVASSNLVIPTINFSA
jgi:hypothetical protein